MMDLGGLSVTALDITAGGLEAQTFTANVVLVVRTDQFSDSCLLLNLSNAAMSKA